MQRCLRFMSTLRDSIQLNKLPLKACLPNYAWKPNDCVLQPITVSIELKANLSKAGLSDDIQDSVSYSDLTKLAQSSVTQDRIYTAGPGQVADEIRNEIQKHALSIVPTCLVRVTVQQPKALFAAESVSARSSSTGHELLIDRLRLDSLIGVNDFERKAKQPLYLDLVASLTSHDAVQVHALAETIIVHNEGCQPLTLETYLESLASRLFEAHHTIATLNLSIAKPFATKWADPPRVSIRRKRPLYRPHPLFDLPKTLVMGIINLTPDSFGTAPHSMEASLAIAKEHVQAGADILDLGGMSTRPGAADVSEDEEIQRVVPFMEALRTQVWAKDVVVSIDTFRANVAKKALQAGADWINDVKAGAHTRDGAMWRVATEFQCPIILMHMRGDPQTMNAMAAYDGDIVEISRRELQERIQEAVQHGVLPSQIIVDPGIGFAKDAQANWKLLRQLEEWHSGSLALYPCLVGTSRKRFLGSLLQNTDPFDRDLATAATAVDAIRQGARIIRVHSVANTIDAIQVADKLYRAGDSIN